SHPRDRWRHAGASIAVIGPCREDICTTPYPYRARSGTFLAIIPDGRFGARPRCRVVTDGDPSPARASITREAPSMVREVERSRFAVRRRATALVAALPLVL